MDMDISMDIHVKSVDMDMDRKFRIHGKPGYSSFRQRFCTRSVSLIISISFDFSVN